MKEGACTLYRHYDAEGALLYVGISSRPGYRLSQHEERSAWWKDIARVDLEKFESRAAALLAEAEADALALPATHAAEAAYQNRMERAA